MPDPAPWAAHLTHQQQAIAAAREPSSETLRAASTQGMADELRAWATRNPGARIVRASWLVRGEDSEMLIHFWPGEGGDAETQPA